jgi:hypothetical protein
MKLKCFALLLALSLLTGCHKVPQEAAIPTDAPHPTQESQEYPEAPPAQSFQEPEIQISLETVSQQGRYRVIFTDALEQNSELKLKDISAGMAAGKLTVTDMVTRKSFTAQCNLTQRQQAILMAGGLLNYTKEGGL